MNELGRAVAEAAHFYKLDAGDVVVFHDEAELAPGKVRVKKGGGNAGHNGLRSISEHIGNDYRRVRLGVGHPGNKDLMEAYVLQDFAKSERPWVEALCEIVADNAGLLIEGKDSTFQNKVHLAMAAKGFGAAEPDDRQGRRLTMGFKCGIVGLPNVGKSTLFNALTQTAAAQAANYPFCTIEPNVGEIAVPDPRLDKLAVLGKSAEIVPTRIGFVDIAGLVRGASKGEGLGNQFLATIREVDAIVHVVRCFVDDDVTHVEGKIDPIADIDTIETELMLADLEVLGKARRQPGEKSQGQRRGRQARQGNARSGRALAGAHARRQAGALGRAQAGRRKAVPFARPAHLGAGALRLQCRRGRGRDRQ